MDEDRSKPIAPPRRSTPLPAPRRARHLRWLWPLFLPLILFSGILINWAALIPPAFAAPLAGTSTPGTNTYQQFLRESQQRTAGQRPFQRPALPANVVHPQISPATSKGASTLKRLPSVEPATMTDLTFTLDDSFVLHRPAMRQSSQPATVQGTTIPAGTGPLVAKGNDGRLEVDVPRGSLDFTHAALADGSTPVGQVFLQIHQLFGHYIGADSILGTYMLQIVDSQGHVVQGVQVVHPLTLIYHYQSWEMIDLNLNPNEVHLSWQEPVARARVANQPTTGLALPMTNDGKAHTLSTQSTMLAGPLTVSGEPEINAPAIPDLFEASGNSGQYSYSYPIAVAPGPDGFTPQLQLSYSSQSTNDRHNRRAPAGDAGEGFSLSLGSITAQQYPASSTGGATTWYFLNGVAGISDRLVPSTTAGFYETEHMSHLSIQFTGSFWRIFGLDGTFYEFGYTPDSVRKTSSSTYEWDLDKIIAPFNSGNQTKTMIVTYLQDSPDGGTTIRDAGIKQIQYGYETNTSPQPVLTQVAGTVDFHYLMPSVPSGQSAFASAYGTNDNCVSAPPSSTTLRCDDPTQFGTIPPPDVMSTMTLDAITSYMGADSANQPAYHYSFSYQDQPFSTFYWDMTDTQMSAAGEHLLTQITPTIYLGGTAHAREPVVFGYTGGLRVSYDDPSHIAFGTTTFSGQTYWQYLNHYQDLATGVGATITYELGYGNPQGTPYVTNSQGQVTDDRFDPFYCNNQATNPDTSKQCQGVYAVHDDYSWSLELVSQISALGTDSSSGTLKVSTTTYNYALTAVPAANDPISSCNPLTGSGVPAQEADCVLDNWSPGYNGTPTSQHDADWQDYYHAEFRGFAVVYTTSSAGNLTSDSYLTTDGWWVPPLGDDVDGGKMYQEDVYQGNVATPSALLRETIQYYVNASRPAGNPYLNLNTCNGNEDPVYVPCVTSPIETKTTFFEGQGGSSSAPWVDVKDTYDDLNGTQGFTYTTSYHNLLQEVMTSSNAPTITKKWTYQQPNIQNGGCCSYLNAYVVNHVIHSEIDDSSGHVWACQDTAYDEGTSVSAPTQGLVTTATSYTTCGNTSTAIKSYLGYDQYGNVVATVDPLTVAHPSLLSSSTSTGCTLSTAPVALASAWTSGRFSSCMQYDITHTMGMPTSVTNAFNQSISTAYDYTSGARVSSNTDANGQATSYGYSYDGSGFETINAGEPGESGAYTTRQMEHSTCTASSTLPCYEIDGNSLLYPNAVSRTFYDSHGRAVETRTPGPTPGDDTVVMIVYNDQANTVFTSEPFQVADGSGWIDPNGAKDTSGVTPAGTTTFADALGRTLAVQDFNFGSAQEPGIACSTVLSGPYTLCTGYSFSNPFDATIYARTEFIDANGHQTFTWTNALGNQVGTGTYAGVYPNDSVAEQITEVQYNALNKPTSVEVVDEHPPTGGQSSVTTTMTYDDQGRLLTMHDPDQGTFSYTYDPDGHVTSVVQTSGSNSRTLGLSYDLLGRVGCVQPAVETLNWSGACTSGPPTLVRNTYDSTNLGTQGSTDFPVGQLTQSLYYTYYPDGSRSGVTYQYQHDQRGRLLNAQMELSLPSSWNVTTALPTFQIGSLYNDANQVTTTTTLAGGQGYTSTNVYDPTTGALQGLSNNGSSTANLATLTYNQHAQVSGLTLLNGASSSPASIASEQFSYDGDLRPAGMTATWLPGSGNTGQILSQSDTSDNAGNRTSVSTTFAAVPGQSGSGGSETQNFCYDEQSRLVWSGNAGTMPAAGSGTCGMQALASALSGASYTAPFSYTNLGQLWQGPLSGKGTTQQYLYCNSAPHELTGIYPVGTTCSTRGSATPVYSASYDPWGNETSRTMGSTTATLSYDALNRLVQWSAGSSSESYVYDTSGEMVLRKSTSGTGLTVSAFGVEEYFYTGSGGFNNAKHYYTLAGHLLGKFNGNFVQYYLTDALGSVILSLTSSAVVGEQLYGPYGAQRYSVGSMSTNDGYTGQLNDALTGLDYDHARWYDPAAGIFLSPDNVQGNASGMNPYGYVSGNPETLTDPTGHDGELDSGDEGGGGSAGSADVGVAPNTGPLGPNTGPLSRETGPLADPTETIQSGDATYTYNSITGEVSETTPTSGADLFPGDDGYPLVLKQFQAALQAAQVDPGPAVNSHTLHQHGIDPSPGPKTQTGGGGTPPPITPKTSTSGGECSFTSDTPVETPQGEQAIGTLQVGDQVMAYNPKTHKMEAEPVQHVWKHTDNDLIDLTLTITTPAHDGKPATRTSEVIHTTSEHPFLTTEQGFVPAGKLKEGMHVQRADGSIGVITDWKQVAGTKTMYNLEVLQDHTFAVGEGEWVVHNRCDSGPLRRNLRLPPNSPSLSQQAQHIVPCQTSGLGSLAHPMVSLAETGNPDFLNGAWNGIGLPDNWGDAARLGLPRHLGSHSNYTGQIIDLLDDEWARLQAAFPGGVSVADAQSGVQSVANWARTKITGAGGGCTINQVIL